VLDLALAAAMASTTMTSGQVAPSPSTREIVVQGVSSRRRATQYIDEILPPTFDDQIGRVEDPICPGVVGLPDALKAQVLARISQVAAAASVPIARGRCTPNLMIIVVDDKKTLIEGMRWKKESYLYGLGTERIKHLENAAQPVAAWQLTDVIGADGMPLRVDGSGFPRLFTTLPPSRITSTTRKRIIGGVVVMEQRGLVNVTTRQLADYALVRLLAPIQSRERTPSNASVLSLFNAGVRPEDAPQSVTWWDLAFLRALADTRSDTQSGVQRDEIRQKMLSEVAKLRLPEE
jgi:hypothetical protein